MNAKVASLLCVLFAACAGSSVAPKQQPAIRGTGDLGVVIERAAGRVAIVDTSERKVVASVPGLGDLSHASIVFSRDARYAYVFGRDGGLTKIDLLTAEIVKRVVQSGNSIGGAISQDGRYIAVSNYTPGGVKVFDSKTLAQVADVPALGADGKLSKVVGIVDIPGNGFVYSLYDSGEIWRLTLASSTPDPSSSAALRRRRGEAAPCVPLHPREAAGKEGEFSQPCTPAEGEEEGVRATVRRMTGAGSLPYDALITPDGRYYVAGLFGEDGMTLVDLWTEEPAPRKVLLGYGKGEEKLPVYKMPHLEGWALTGRLNLVPAVGRHEVLVVDNETWQEVGRIPVHGQPVFVVARPDGRQAWVNFAFPDNDTVQVIDIPGRKVVRELKPGKTVLHLEFTPRGEEVWVSVRDEDKVVVYDTATFEEKAVLKADKPSGIFFTPRAHRMGM